MGLARLLANASLIPTHPRLRTVNLTPAPAQSCPTTSGAAEGPRGRRHRPGGGSVEPIGVVLKLRRRACRKRDRNRDRVHGNDDALETDYASNITYDKFGQRLSMTNGNGVITTYIMPTDRTTAAPGTSGGRGPVFL